LLRAVWGRSKVMAVWGRSRVMAVWGRSKVMAVCVPAVLGVADQTVVSIHCLMFGGKIFT